MLNKLTQLAFNLIYFFDKILFKKKITLKFYDFLQRKSYRSITIHEKKVKFYIPNSLIEWRINTFFTKEPETLNWIDDFENKENLIFWDIGSNIGLYSIYNSLRNPKAITFSFEPSSSNLRVLTRNISINNLENKINVVPMPLTNVKNVFSEMNELDFVEGGALNSFGVRYDYSGSDFKPYMKYRVLGTTLNYFVENSILDIPDYIKIDVDGIEHLILQGGDKFLNDNKIKSILIEVNEDFIEQYNTVLKLMTKYNFKILTKKKCSILDNNDFSKTYNYIFVREN